MPYLVMQRVKGGPNQLSFRPQSSDKSWGERRRHKAGETLWVEDEYLDYYLSYSHKCEDKVSRRIFTEPQESSKAAVEEYQDRQHETMQAVIDILEKKTGEDLSEIRKLMGPGPKTSPMVQRVTRCKSCNQKVKTRPDDTECPHCGGLLSGDGTITSQDLKSDELDVSAEILACPEDGCDFTTPPDAKRPSMSLSMHMRRAHPDTE